MTFREFMLENGYELQTTFWNDFSIADRFGLSAIFHRIILALLFIVLRPCLLGHQALAQAAERPHFLSDMGGKRIEQDLSLIHISAA